MSEYDNENLWFDLDDFRDPRACNVKNVNDDNYQLMQDYQAIKEILIIEFEIPIARIAIKKAIAVKEKNPRGDVKSLFNLYFDRYMNMAIKKYATRIVMNKSIHQREDNK